MRPEEILEALGTAVLLLDEAFNLLEANPAAQELLSAGIQQVRGRSLPDLLHLPTSLGEVLARAPGGAGTYAEREVQVRTGGGEERIIDVFVTPLENAAGERRLLVEIADATQRARISRDAALLAQLGGSRTMARQLAHEIKNPLGGMRGAAQLLQKQLGEGELREYTQVIINEIDRLAALVDSMLGPARLPQIEPANLHELCERVLRLLQNEAPPQVSFARDYDPSLPEAPLDINMMIQAMLNLGRNALEAVSRNEGGAGRIVVRTRALHNQYIGATRHRLVSSIQFEDDGPGVASELRETLFYPLVTGRAGGAGLGLAIAQDLVSRHGGLIEFDSMPGRTQFTILLPCPQPKSG